MRDKKEKAKPNVGLEAARKAAKAKTTKRKTENKISYINQISEDTMATTKPNFEKISADAATNSKEHLDALMQSGNLFAKGAEDFMKTYVGLAQESAEKSAEAVKTLLACKTLNELTETQTRLAQDSFEQYMTGFTKLSEIGVKLATETFQPITTQVSKTVKRASEAAAA